MEWHLPIGCWIVLLLGVIVWLAFTRKQLWVWTLSFILLLAGFTAWTAASLLTNMFVWLLFLSLATVLNVLPIRRRFISGYILAMFRKVLPPISLTEREALEAGSVWWDAELFSGRPDWRKLTNLPPLCLSADEQAFLDGPTEELCSMLDEWQIDQMDYDLPANVWEFLREQRFFGMIIPKRFGGLEFSALAHSEVIMKIASRSLTCAVTTMVPNSLGPGQLLLL